MMYVWGHSFEFTRNNNCEIVDYNKVFDRLQFAADNSFVYNPSAASAWLCINNTQIVEVKGGTLVHLS